MALSQPDRAFAERLTALRGAVVARVESAYRSVDPGAIAQSFDEFVGVVAPTITAGQDAAQQLTVAYLARAAADQGLDGWEPDPTNDAIPGTNRAGTPIGEAMGGIVPMILGAIADGTPAADALDSGRYYATRFADNEVRDASDREQQDQETNANEIVGWYGDAGECDRCQDNEGEHSLDDEMYRHPGCTCVRTPIFALSDGDLKGAAETAVDIATEHEPIVTDDLQRIESGINGDLVGLDHRIKSVDSTLTKFKGDMAGGRMSLGEAAANIKDSLRYTYRLDDASYGPDARSVLSELESRGYSIDRAKNFWSQGDGYTGINMIVKTPDGYRFELQFHTEASLAAKDPSHALYEAQRILSRDDPKFAALQREIDALWEPIRANPPDLSGWE